ncbi:MAG: HAMP domain-containing histidine kinase, partial [Chloroflexi bacterium]
AIMDTQLNKLTKLINDLLDISKMQQGKLDYQEEPFDLVALIQEVVENLQAGTSTHQLLIEGRTEVQVYGDRDRIGQVLINLLTNAIKYSPRADTVSVRVSKDQENAMVSVQDCGIGIAAADHEHIFERFYQVTDREENIYPGLGMGLYICAEIIKRHHGRIWVESRKDHGSTFSFTLPLTYAS